MTFVQISEMGTLLNNSDVLVNCSALISDSDLASVNLFKGYPDGLMRFATACCFIFMMIGIPGNIITIVALARYEKVSYSLVSVVNYY